MHRILAIFVLFLFTTGCSEDVISHKEFRELNNAYAEQYLTGDPIAAKQSLWDQIRLTERAHREIPEWFNDWGYQYTLALCYTRLALIYEAEELDQISDSLYSYALRYWAECFDIMGTEDNELQWKVSRLMAQFHVDSLDHGKNIRWRSELDSPPIYYVPKYEVGEEGTVRKAE